MARRSRERRVIVIEPKRTQSSPHNANITGNASTQNRAQAGRQVSGGRKRKGSARTRARPVSDPFTDPNYDIYESSIPSPYEDPYQLEGDYGYYEPPPPPQPLPEYELLDSYLEFDPPPPPPLPYEERIEPYRPARRVRAPAQKAVDMSFSGAYENPYDDPYKPASADPYHDSYYNPTPTPPLPPPPSRLPPKAVPVTYEARTYKTAKVHPTLPTKKRKMSISPVVMIVLQGLMILFYIWLLVRYGVIPARPIATLAVLLVFMGMVVGILVKTLYHVRANYKGELTELLAIFIFGFLGIYGVFYLVEQKILFYQQAVMYSMAIGFAISVGVTVRFVFFAFSKKR